VITGRFNPRWSELAVEPRRMPGMTSETTLDGAPPLRADDPPRSLWRSVGTLRGLVTFLIAMNGLYLLFVAFGNITDFPANQAFVQHVLAMDTTNFGAPAGAGLDPRVMWRAITSPGLQNAAYVGLIAWETLAGLVLAAAVLCRLRGSDPQRAQWLATAGLLMMLALFFGGFIVVGGEWFQMWRSTAWNGLDPAFRNTVIALATAMLVHLDGRSTAAPQTEG
jgi:predicted small integral membrane protein